MTASYRCTTISLSIISFLLSAPLAAQSTLASQTAPSAKIAEVSADTTTIKKKKTHQEKKQAQKERLAKKQPKKTLRDMTYPELKAAKDKYLLANDKHTALRFFEKMVPMCNDLDDQRVIMLEFADLLFDTGDLEKAGKMYAEFSALYRGNAKVEYASYKGILCNFYATLDAEHDQTKTKDTIELAQNFLARQDVFTTHAKDVTEILHNCQKKLFDNEVTIFNFYLNRGSFKSAQKRLEGLRKDFIGVLPVEPQLLVLECTLAERQNNNDLLTKKQAELSEKFPSFAQELAQAKGAEKKSFMARF